MISPELARRGAAIEHARTSSPQVVRVLQMALASRANEDQGTTWGGMRGKAKRHKRQRDAARVALEGAGAGLVWARWGWLGAVVCIVRIAHRKLDSDNAEHAAKSIRDGVADALRVHDRHPRVEWLVDQDFGDPAVRVELYRWDAALGFQAGRSRAKRSKPARGLSQTGITQPRASLRPSRSMTKVSQSLFHP